jgi:hypothetical protein
MENIMTQLSESTIITANRLYNIYRQIEKRARLCWSEVLAEADNEDEGRDYLEIAEIYRCKAERLLPIIAYEPPNPACGCCGGTGLIHRRNPETGYRRALWCPRCYPVIQPRLTLYTPRCPVCKDTGYVYWQHSVDQFAAEPCPNCECEQYHDDPALAGCLNGGGGY